MILQRFVSLYKVITGQAFEICLPNRDVERRFSYSTLSDLSPSISNEVSPMNSFSINFLNQKSCVPNLISGLYFLLSKDDIPLQDISNEGTDVRSLLIGLATTAFAGLCFTSGNTMVKLLPPGSSYDILLLRSLIQVQHNIFHRPM